MNLFSFNKKSYKENISINGVKSISIYSLSAKITVIPENRNDIYVELDSYTNGPKLYIEDGRDVVIESKKKNWFLFSLTAKAPKLRVYIPRDYNKSLFTKSTSGSINISDFETDDFEVHSTSGTVDVSNIEAGDIKVDTTSGSIEINRVNASNGYVKSTSGSIDIENCKIDDFETKLTSGRLDINNFSGNIKGRSTSGSVNIDMKKLKGDIFFKLTSGSFNLEIDDDDLNSTLKLKSLSGRVKCEYPVTTTGEFEKKKVYGVSGDPINTIEISTTSSSINITKA